ncbi:DUF4302 domain-containing protein [Sinomicrobium sp. M5D2P17]
MRTIIKNVYVLCVISILFCACKNDDDQELFNETATKRISEREQELKKLLTSSAHGWKAIYFTNPDQFGGFTLLMDFDEKGHVKMASDIDEDIEEKTSIYDINLGNTVKLTFSTKNHINKLNDSYVPEVLKGTGFEGDNEFSFYGTDGDMIIFRGVKNNTEVIFEKASEEDRTNLITQNREMINNITSRPEDPVYQVIKITGNGKSSLYNFNYNSLMRFVKSVTPTDGNKLIERSFGVGFTPEGLVLNPPLEIESEEFTDFTWDKENRKFVSRSEGFVAEIMYSNKPAYINDDYKNIGSSVHSLAFSPGERFDQVLNTQRFREMYSQVNIDAQKDHPEFRLQDIVLKFNKQADDPQNTHTLDLYFFYGQTRYFASYAVEFKKEDKKLKFKYLNEVNGNASDFKEYLMPLINFFTNPEGLIVNNEGRFWPQYTNPGYTLTSAEDATLRVHCASNFYNNN